jgi:hypothetical protein
MLFFLHILFTFTWNGCNIFNFPNFYKLDFNINFIGLIFLSYFGIRFSGETKKRSEALNKLQEVIAKEYELESLRRASRSCSSFTRNSFSNNKCCSQRVKKRNW